MASLPTETGDLHAGAAVQSLMTDRPSAAVHDPLCAKAVVFDNGNTRIAIVGIDLIRVSDELVAEVRRLVQAQGSVPPSNVLINASHNHRTRGQEAEDAAERIAQAVVRAAGSMVPVRIGVCKGHEDRITMNRRLELKDGKAWTIRHANPTPRDEDVTGVGPMDPEIGILRVDRVEGGTLALLYNFACHPYGGVPNGGVTADLPGFASRVVENGLGGHDTVGLFLQGAAGDITPVRHKDWDAPPHTEQFGSMLGMSVLEAAGQAEMKDDSRIQAVTEAIELPRRTDLAQCLDVLEAQQEEILQFYSGVGCGTLGDVTSLDFKTFLPLYLKHAMDPSCPSYHSYLYMQEEQTGRADLQHLDARNRQRIGKYLQSIHNMERLIRIRNKRQLIERQIQRGERGPLRAEVQAMRIGDFVLVSFPGEPFAEVGLNIKQRSPFEFTYLASCSNGSIGYAPTADAYGGEAYEDALTRLAPEWQARYEEKALKMIGELR